MYRVAGDPSGGVNSCDDVVFEWTASRPGALPKLQLLPRRPRPWAIPAEIHRPGTRQARDQNAARLSRQHNDANVLCLSADSVETRLNEAITAAWLETAFDGGRHGRRVAKIGELESRQSQ